MIRIYSMVDSNNALKPLFLLEEAGVGYEALRVGRRNGQIRKREFLAINPFGLVPVVEIDGERLYESNAILRYLARKFAPGLYPVDQPLRCQRIDMWLDMLSTGYRPRVWPYEQFVLYRNLYERRPREVEAEKWTEDTILIARSQEDADTYRKRALDFLRRCELVHPGSPWCTSEFSIADISWACSFERARRMELNLAHLPKVNAWAKAVLERPAFGRAWKRC